MLRRTFFKSIGSNLALALLAPWSRQRAVAAETPQPASYGDVAAAVLPESLGAKRLAEVVAGFELWISGFPAGADAGYGYGYPVPKRLGPSPSLHYGDQLKSLDASSEGGRFSALDHRSRQAIVQRALSEAGIAAIPARPNGKHIATDIMSYFYGSSDGKDFCYNAAIREMDCRGLAGSEQRPAALV
jgi:hypothetical protein